MRTLEELKKEINGLISEHDASNRQFFISKPNPKTDNWYLMIRQHDLGGVDYDYVYKMSSEEAKLVVAEEILEPWFIHRDFLDWQDEN